MLVFATVGLFASGIALVAVGPAAPLVLLLHKASFAVWLAAMSVHVLAHVVKIPGLTAPDLRGGEGVPGSRLRLSLVAVPSRPARSSPSPRCRSCRRGRTGSASEPLADVDHEERDRDVLARDRDERQRVEDLVVPEDGGYRVRAPERIDERADRVREPTRGEERERRPAGVLDDLRHRGDPGPADGDAVTAESHFGAPTQRNFRMIAAAAPLQTIASTIGRVRPCTTSSPTGVYVPAIRR